MPKLNRLGHELPLKLAQAIDAYNKEGATDLEKLFNLQIMSTFTKASVNPQIVAWRNETGNEGFEQQLQIYGIHKDASSLQQSIEFSGAVKNFAKDLVVEATPLYKAISERESSISIENKEDALKAFVKSNVAIYDNYVKDKALQEKVQRNADYLALTYAKLEAIQGLVTQNFAEYDTKVLGNADGNNKNFILTVSDQEKLVIRVEDRNTLGREQQLQAHEVSEYFSEDYATLMLPVEIDGYTEYRPVVISQLANGGDLEGHAKKMAGKTPEAITAEAQSLFTQLSDFCIKLKNSGHYHPDIKLSNFLLNDGKVLISDRKTLTDKKNPTVLDISSSPVYAAPEYKRCLTINDEGETSLNLLKARKTTLDMPSYMSYQMGMALKEFVIKSNLVSFSPTDDEEETFQKFVEWNSVSSLSPNPSKELQNISVLIEELTRSKPEERLSIENLNTLIKQVVLPPEQFIQKLNEASPVSAQSRERDKANIQLIDSILKSDNISPVQREQLSAIPNCKSLLNKTPIKSSLDGYFKQVEAELYKADVNKLGFFSRIGHKLGLVTLPRVSTIQNLDPKVMPVPDQKTKELLEICREVGYKAHPMQTELYEVLKANSEVKHKAAAVKLSPTTIRQESSLPELDSGTFVRADDTGSVVRNDDTGSVVRHDDTGSVVRHDDTGSVVRHDDTGSVVRHDDTGSVVRADDTGSVVRADDKGTSVTKEDAPKKRNGAGYNLAAALASFDDEQVVGPKVSVKSTPVEDISTTIARGNKMKAQLHTIIPHEVAPVVSEVALKEKEEEEAENVRTMTNS